MDIERFSGLIAIQNAIGAVNGDLDRVMRVIVDERSVMPQSNGAVVELRDGDQIYYAAASGASAGMIGLHLPLYKSMSGACILSGEPMVCDDARTDPRVNRQACERVGLRSMICVPIPHKGEVVGVLKYHAAEPAAFTPEDVLIAQLLVGPLAVGFSSVAEADAIRARRELQTLVTFKEQFISTVSHELRTPLTSIIGALTFLDKGMVGTLPDTAAPLIGIAARNADRLLRLINDLLDMDRLDSNRMALARAIEPLQALLATVVEENGPFANAAGVSLHLTAPEETLYAAIDRDRLFQAITNLVSNAAKFSPAGSVVRIVLARTEDRATIRVIDEGPGIPAEFRPRLFERFSQSGQTARLTNLPGSGLGLAIARGIVEQLDGAIRLVEKATAGATFEIALPLAEAPEPAEASAFTAFAARG